MTPTLAALISGLIAASLIAVGFTANFYLACQWLVYPKLRYRLRVCKPYLAAGWALYVLGGSVLAPVGRAQGAGIVSAVGYLLAFIGLVLTVHASIRLLRANAAERRAKREARAGTPPGGVWPPPPNLPPA